MDTWVRWAYDHAPSFIRSAVDWVVQFVLGMVSVLTNAMHWVGVSWGRLRTAIDRAQVAVRDFFGNVYLTLKWLKDVAIPRAVNAAIATLRAWATAAINTARNLALAAVNTLERWARSAVNAALSTIETVRRWATDRINSLLAGLGALRTALLHVLGGPGVLAGWLAAAMWRALTGYLNSNLDRWVTAAWTGRNALGLRLLALTDRIIGRIL